MLDFDLVSRARSALVEAMGSEDRQRRAAGLATLAGEEERGWAATFVASILAEENRSRLQGGLARLAAAEEQEVLDGVDALVFGMGRFQRFLVDLDVDNVIVHGGESVVIEWCEGRVTEDPPPGPTTPTWKPSCGVWPAVAAGPSAGSTPATPGSTCGCPTGAG